MLPAVARARDTVEALNAENGTPRNWVFWSAVAASAACLIALPLVEVTVTVRAPGIVRPVEAPVEIRAPVSGCLAEVFAKENVAVSANEPLFEIGAPESDERMETLQRRSDELEPLLHDLVALTEANDLKEVIVPSAVAEGALRTPLYRSELLRLRSVLAASNVERAQLARELERTKALHSRRLIPDKDLDAACDAIGRIEASTDATVADVLARWQAERRNCEDTRKSIQSDIRELVELRARRLVRAPVAGDLIGFSGWKKGVFVAEGQVIAAISPPGAMRVETSIRSRDLALLAPGLPARVECEAFPATEWGYLDGFVESIDRDVRWIDGLASRRMLVGFMPTGPEGGAKYANRLQKGMGAVVRVVVGRRSLWHYLTESTNRWLEESPNGK